MVDRMSQIRSKIERANRHISELEATWDRFRQTRPYRLIVDHNPEKRERIYKVDVASELPVDIPLQAGDAVHNLRSSLDHLVCHLIAANGNSITNRSEFPIFETSPKDKSKFMAKVQGAHPIAINLIEAAQPYNTGVDDLRKLHELDIADKHRLLLVVAMSNLKAAVELWDGNPTSGRMILGRDFSNFVLKDNAEIGAVIGTELAEGVKENFHFSVEIAFSEPQIVRAKPVLDLLKQLSHTVTGVVDQFAAYL